MKYWHGVNIRMANTLPDAKIIRMDGDELFLETGVHQLKLADFWAWSSSDLLNNAKRGVLAEFLVASDLGIADGFRIEWDAYDLTTPSGITVEVKSAAYLQSWKQDKLSDIGFSIAQSKAWSPLTNRFSTESKRQADVYVFCLLDHKDKSTVNPMDLNQWRFFVLPTTILDEEYGSMKRISLTKLLRLSPEQVVYGEISNAVMKFR